MLLELSIVVGWWSWILSVVLYYRSFDGIRMVSP